MVTGRGRIFFNAGGYPAAYIAVGNGFEWLPAREWAGFNRPSRDRNANGDIVARGLLTTSGGGARPSNRIAGMIQLARYGRRAQTNIP